MWVLTKIFSQPVASKSFETVVFLNNVLGMGHFQHFRQKWVVKIIQLFHPPMFLEYLCRLNPVGSAGILFGKRDHEKLTSPRGLPKCIYQRRYTYIFVVLISMLWRMLESKWDTLSSSAETRVHYYDVIMGPIASQITSPTIVYSIVYSDADQGKHQSSASLAFVRGIHRGLVNSPYKWQVTRKMFPFDDVIMLNLGGVSGSYSPPYIECLLTNRPRYRGSSQNIWTR